MWCSVPCLTGLLGRLPILFYRGISLEFEARPPWRLYLRRGRETGGAAGSFDVGARRIPPATCEGSYIDGRATLNCALDF